MMHIPSFFVGSITSGSAFLLVHQQLSNREHLSRRWPMAEWAEKELRTQLKNVQAFTQDSSTFAPEAKDPFGKETVAKYYKQMLDEAHNFFGKKD